MAVRHPLFRQGLPLQKTMQNRAGDKYDIIYFALCCAVLCWVVLDWILKHLCAYLSVLLFI